MSITFTCPHCQVQIAAPDTAAGTEGPCPHCQGAVLVPATLGSPANRTVKACPQCGKEILAEAVFCKHCRTSLTAPSPPAGAVTGSATPSAATAPPQPAAVTEPTLVATCPQCRISKEVPAAMTGKMTLCENCRTTFKVMPPQQPEPKFNSWKNPKARALAIGIFVLFAVLRMLKGCFGGGGDEAQMLSDVSGAWSTGGYGAEVITIDLIHENKTVTVKDVAYPVTVKGIDQDNSRVTIDAGAGQGEKIWTIRKEMNEDGKSFTINLTYENGSSIDLDFVHAL